MLTKSVEASCATKKTLHQRIQNIREARIALGIELEEKIRALSKQQRPNLLREVGLPLEIPINCTLAIKSNLAISWTKLRTLRRYTNCNSQLMYTSMYVHCRWLKTFSASLTCERKQRKLAETALGNTSLLQEMVPFTFSKEGKGEEIHEALFVHVRNIIAAVSDRLMEQQR